MELSRLKPYSKNAKKHSEKQIKSVAESIKRFGFIQPIVVDKNNECVIGHCRLEAAKLLGLKEVPTISVENLSDEEVKALRLADNKLNESEWDMGLVIEELKGLSDDLFDLTGFDKDVLILNDLDEIDFERFNVLGIEPPESPILKERVLMRCKNIEDYKKIKDYIMENGDREIIDLILGIL